MVAKLTVDDLLEELEEARIAALEEGQPGAAVNASVAKAKLLGLLVERAEVGVMHKPGIAKQAIELTEDEWQRQFALPSPANDPKALSPKRTKRNDR
jgi:hypothetical protein